MHPLLDGEGRLVGSFSSSDLRGIALHDDFLGLLSPIMVWMQTIRRDEGQAYMTLRAVAEEDEASVALKRLVDGRLHRIFVVDDTASKKPKGLVTLSDMLRHVKLE